MKPLFKKHGWYPILVFIPVILFGFVLFASAAIKPVQVKDTDKTRSINAEVANIASNTEIDTTAPFTADEKKNAKAGLVLTQEEGDTIDAVLTKESIELIDPNAVYSLVSAMQKMHDEKALSAEEQKMLFGLEGKKREAGDNIKYLSRKKNKEIK